MDIISISITDIGTVLIVILIAFGYLMYRLGLQSRVL